MNSFQDALKAITRTAPEDKRAHAAAHLQTLLKHPRLRQFQKAHPEIDRNAYARSLNRLAQYVKEWDQCDQCPGLARCPNLVSGHQPHLQPYAGYLDLHLKPCPLKRQADQEARKTKKIRSHYIPHDVLSVTFEKLELDAERKDAILAAMRFAAEYHTSERKIGLYLYGDFGVGKSCIAGAMVQELAQRDVSVYMVYVPEFFRELKESIQDGSTNEKIEALKQASVLVLDDIGAESMTPWTRDEVLGSILQYRVYRELPTVYTSNLSYDELEAHLSYSQKSGFEEQKARRLMERIRHETEMYRVGGPNRRSR